VSDQEASEASQELSELRPEAMDPALRVSEYTVQSYCILSEMNKVEIWHGSRMVEFSYNVNDTAS
jgi:hypothetical protein